MLRVPLSDTTVNYRTNVFVHPKVRGIRKYLPLLPATFGQTGSMNKVCVWLNNLQPAFFCLF